MARSAPSDPPPVERLTAAGRERLLGQMRTCADKYATSKARTDQLEAERTQLMIRAREVTPRITFAEIASAFGIGETAVIQKIERAKATAAKAGA